MVRNTVLRLGRSSHLHHLRGTETRQQMKAKLLHFIDTTDHYEVDRLFGLLPSDGMLTMTVAVPFAKLKSRRFVRGESNSIRTARPT